LDELHRVARRHRAIFLKIEPPILDDPAISQRLQGYRFRPSHYTNHPRATLILDLTRDLEDIQKQMRKKTRQYIRRAAREGVTVRIGRSGDLPTFCDLMQATGRERQFASRSRDYYTHEWQIFADVKQAVLLMAFYQDQLLAVRSVYRFENHAAEFHAGSSGELAGLRPNYLLMWEAIKWAKAQGCHTYDLWGIPYESGRAMCEGKDLGVLDRTDGMWGVHRFKSGFCKNAVVYAGAHDRVYRWLPYALVMNGLLKGDRLDKIAVWMDTLKDP
jgi:lipid II:glycine glycyltransferase (peptidoglycan interpeptide bridge formation enzyme)